MSTECIYSCCSDLRRSPLSNADFAARAAASLSAMVSRHPYRSLLALDTPHTYSGVFFDRGFSDIFCFAHFRHVLAAKAVSFTVGF